MAYILKRFPHDALGNYVPSTRYGRGTSPVIDERTRQVLLHDYVAGYIDWKRQNDFFDWEDVGSWSALRSQARPNADNNIIRGLVACLDTTDSMIVSSPNHLVAAIDVRNLIIVHTDDATLVCAEQSAQRVKELVQELNKNPEFKKRQESFEKRLKLTDEQKAQAKEMRQKSFEQMKPIMEKIKEKRQEIEAVKRSRMAVEMQQEKITELQKELKALKRAAHELRMQNMKDFEAILTKKQLKELKKMKEEGRKNFEKNHKKGGHPEFGPRPGFGGPEGPRPEGPCPQAAAPESEAK